MKSQTPEIFCHFCNIPVMPSKDRIPALAAIIERETCASELLEALKALLSDCEDLDIVPGRTKAVREQARAAIARATTQKANSQ